jgi:sulfopyruvate decarboxylase subunit beta
VELQHVFEGLLARRTDEVVVATMTAGYLWPKVSKSDRDFCFIAPMGAAPAIGLGLALARPDLRVWVLDGDGSLMMNLGVLVTIAARRPPNLVHLVMDNGVYAITGGQPVVGSAPDRLSGLAAAAGIDRVHRITDEPGWAAFLDDGIDAVGPVFADVHVRNAYDASAAPGYTLGAQAARTQGGPGFHNLRAVLAR